jgi:hypothetical protein
MQMSFPLVQILVYAQPALWLWLWDKKHRIPPMSLLLLGIVGAAGVALSGLSYGFYTNTLLIFYILSVVAVAYHYRDKTNLQPICLGFLLVFVNSFYWEFPIHVADFLEFDSFGVVAIQALHLWPLPFLLKKAGFTIGDRWWYTSAVAWTVIAVLQVLYMQLPNASPNILYLSRAIGLYTLLYILRFPGYGGKVIFKLKEALSV